MKIERDDRMAFDGVFTHYLVNELKENLNNGRINKIYQVSNNELVFVIRANGKTHKCLLSIHPVYARVQLTQGDFTYPQEPPMFCMLLRKHLEGGIIQSIEQKDNDRIILFDVEYMNEIGDRDHKQLIIEVMGKHSNIVLINKETQRIIDCIKHVSPFQNSYRTLQPGADYIFPPTNDKINFFKAKLADFEHFQPESNLTKQIVNYFEGVSPILANELLNIAMNHTPIALFQAYQDLIQKFETRLAPSIITTEAKSYFYLTQLTSIDGEVKTFDSLSDLLDRFFFMKDDQARIRQQTQDLEKFIKNELDKNTNKLNHLSNDLQAAQDASIFKLYGELIISNAFQIQKGMASVEVENYYENQALLTIELDPFLTPVQNSQKYYTKYQKGKKAIGHILEQIELTKTEVIYFETLTQQIQSASLDDALEIRSELEELRYLKRRSKAKQKKRTKLQYETYLIDQASVFVGKNNLQNDFLTFKHANKEDMWFHVKDMPGSHVIVRSEIPLTEEMIRTGAQLASYYSKGKLSSSVPIDFTLIKHVKKIPGAKPGFVTYDHQKTIYMDPDEDYIHALTQGTPSL